MSEQQENSRVTTDIGPYSIIPIWLLQYDLDGASLRVYIALRSFADSGGDCFPSREAVAERAGLSVSSYKRAMVKLEEINVVAKTARTRSDGGLAGWNFHISTLPPKVSPPRSIPEPPPAHLQAPPGSPAEPAKDSFEVNRPVEPTTNPLISSNEEIISPRARAHTRVGAPARAAQANPSQDGQGTLDGMPSPTSSRPVVPINRKAEETFAKFWAVYPRKTAKKDAWKAWPKAIKAADPDVIMAGLDRYVVELHRTGSYVAHATTWLNGQRWEDEPATVGNAGRSGSDRRGSGGYARHFEHLADDAYDAPMNY
jgi:hypothetical protein